MFGGIKLFLFPRKQQLHTSRHMHTRAIEPVEYQQSHAILARSERQHHKPLAS